MFSAQHLLSHASAQCSLGGTPALFFFALLCFFSKTSGAGREVQGWSKNDSSGLEQDN
jgi:hypothetical protein